MYLESNPCKADEIRKHIERLHRLASDIPGELVLSCISGPKIRNFTFAVGDPEGMIARALDEAQKLCTNIYFGPYVLRRGAGEDNKRGRLEDVLAVLMLGVDQDADHEREGSLPLKPDLVIKTSETARPDGSKAINHQAFYIFDPANRPSVTEAAQLGRALRQATHADTPTGDIVRLYRVPGTANWPSGLKIARGRSSQPQLVVVEQEPIGFTDVSALRSACLTANEGVDATEQTDSATDIADPGLLSRVTERLRKALNRHDTVGDRSPAAWGALTLAVEEGLSDNEIGSLILAHPSGVGQRYLSNHASLREEIARARTKSNGSSKDADLPSGFRRADDGSLLYRRGGKEEETSCMRLCSPLWVIARARDYDENNWGRVVEILTPTNEKRRIFVAASDLHVTSGDRDPLACLSGAGLEIYEPGERSRLRKVLAHPIDRFARVARRTGWQEKKFVLPHGAINGSSGELHIWDGDESHEDAFRAQGSLEEWQSQVAKPAQDHPLLALAVSMAFVGPCLRLADYSDDFGLHIYGRSSRGKTTAVDVAASVWGNPKDFSRTWRGTSNGFESIAAARNDTLLVLDELKQVAPQDLAQCIYMLAQGRGKQRANRSGDARRTHEWRLVYLSSGETTLADHLRSAPYQKPMPGQHVRCLEISLPDEEHGVFESIASAEERAKLAQHLQHEARTFYGTAGSAFVCGLTRDVESARKWLQVASNGFRQAILDSLPQVSSADGQVQRALGHFSMIYAAGAVACEFSILPFPATCIHKAVKSAFHSWIDMRGGYSSFEEERAIASIREFIELHASRFQSEGDSPPRERAGLQVRKNGLLCYAFLPAAWRTGVCEHQNPTAVAKVALQHDFLEPERDARGDVVNLQNKVSLDGQRVRAYLIKASILGEEAAAHEDGDADVIYGMKFLKRTNLATV
jgi:putative DNA primase/helicase